MTAPTGRLVQGLGGLGGAVDWLVRGSVGTASFFASVCLGSLCFALLVLFLARCLSLLRVWRRHRGWIMVVLARLSCAFLDGAGGMELCWSSSGLKVCCPSQYLNIGMGHLDDLVGRKGAGARSLLVAIRYYTGRCASR